MRILIAGSNRAANTALATHCVSDAPGNWEVISSYQASCTEWEKLPNVTKVTSYHDLKDGEADDSQGLVLEVVAASFFEKSWVKTRLASATDLIMVTSSPVAYIDKAVLHTFHQVLLTKSTTPEKQAQYHTLFIDVKKIPFVTFKKAVKALEDHHYLSVAADGSITTGSWTEAPSQDHGLAATVSKTASKLESKTGSKPGLQVSASSYVSQVQAQAVDTAEKKTATPAVNEGKSPPDVVPRQNRPSNVEVADGVTELWICFTAQSRKKTKDMLDHAVTMFEDMLSNDLLISMFSTAFHEKHEEDQSVSVYFQVYKQRQDLFVALMMNILQSLRSSHVITNGSIVI